MQGLRPPEEGLEVSFADLAARYEDDGEDAAQPIQRPKQDSTAPGLEHPAEVLKPNEAAPAVPEENEEQDYAEFLEASDLDSDGMHSPLSLACESLHGLFQA